MPEDPVITPEEGNTAQTTTTPVPDLTQQPAAKVKGNEGGANSIDVMYREKIDGLHADLNSVRTKLKTTEADREALQAQVNEFTIRDKKSSAFAAALGELGEDFEIRAEKLPELQKVVQALADGDTLEDSIKSLVTAAKSSKETQKVGNTPFFGTPTQAGSKTGNLTGAQLFELSKNDKEAFKEALRKQEKG